MLYTLRQRLRTDSTTTHDWASIVAYAVVPWNFDRDVEAFRNHQIRWRIEAVFDEAEARVHGGYNKSIPELEASVAQMEPVYADMRNELAQWRQALPADAEPRERAERLGVSAATEKLIGDSNCWGSSPEVKAAPAYEQALDLYLGALQADPVNHWLITQ